MLPNADIQSEVRRHYARIATGKQTSCGCGTSCCDDATADRQAGLMGYSTAEIEVVPEESNLGLGCGNPTAIAGLSEGEVVLDLGSGAGFDCFLAARKVGSRGRVIGVDMTPEMIAKARQNADRGNYGNVEFRLGEIEHLPVESNAVDVIISNCVINLTPDKGVVMAEMFRVLKPGGRIAIADVVATGDVPEEVRSDTNLWSSCAAGALPRSQWESGLRDRGFVSISVTPKDSSRDLIKEWSPGSRLEDLFISAEIAAMKPF
ncbi:MAG: arsenite methyltransferase [Calditrichaeota bacterium]|nr:arsenite methyltransferase [Calditrichota bacterium]